MVLPTTYTAALALLFLSMLCWGSWANTLKLAGPKWRFELFYYDYTIGILLAAVIAAFTFGTFGTDIGFADRFLIAGRRAQLFVLAGGIVFNLANMLIVAAISLAGLAVAFPIGIGLALIIGVSWNYYLNPQGNPALLFAGLALVVLAILIDSAAYRIRDRALPVKPSKTPSKKVARTWRGITMSLFGGLLMGTFYPLVEQGMPGDIGLGPYGAALIFAIGVFISTPLFNVFFLNLPVAGGPRIPFSAYLTGTFRQHALGVAGGIIWTIGAIANFCAASAQNVNVGPAVSLAIGQCATLISVLWGLLVWHEFRGAPPQARKLVMLTICCFVAGLAALCLAPLV